MYSFYILFLNKSDLLVYGAVYLSTGCCRQSFVKINIFYEDLNYENITEVEDYEVSGI